MKSFHIIFLNVFAEKEQTNRNPELNLEFNHSTKWINQ